MSIPFELEECREKIREVAVEYGLDFYETVFEILDYGQLNEVAAYGQEYGQQIRVETRGIA